jgi:predicted transposase/invertase (TIGR01784 family)
MIFLDPRIDIAFKKLFGDITRKNVTMSFLNNLLARTEGNKIVDLIINDPNNIPETLDAKSSIVDVRCTDQSGLQYIVEMQVSTQKDYGTRALYYSSLAFARQLARGERYEKLMPVIFVGILDFALFRNKDYISNHAILDTKTFECEIRKLEFHFIELAKFRKTFEESLTIIDQWIWSLKNAGTAQKIPASLRDPALQDAFEILEQANWSKGELEVYDRKLDEERSRLSQLDTAEENKALKIAYNLLLRNILDVEAIAEITGLTIDQVEELKKQAK